ncbi:MAG: type II toxin-antitoxin system mRNA interferase toxin, RelE/StbE family [Nitrospirae bacterium]|nr:type II toxin-antitoxin system mRNA interferase toxin, RelE/StbE family [Nitrospirota bacterium]
MIKYRLAPTSIYKRAHKAFIKKHPELKDNIEERLNLLQENPQDPSLKNHRLTGQLKGLHAISISYEYRLVFKTEGEIIYLLNIGIHDDVY